MHTLTSRSGVGRSVHAVIESDFEQQENVQRMMRDWRAMMPMLTPTTEHYPTIERVNYEEIISQNDEE